MKNIILLTIIMVFVSGCATMSGSDRAMLREIESYGISSTDQRIKHPGVAAGLNVLPGFGNFYLAFGTHESSQWLFGCFNLFMWPISILWGVPEGAIDAKTMNKKETVYYYNFNRHGKKEFQKIKSADLREPPQ